MTRRFITWRSCLSGASRANATGSTCMCTGALRPSSVARLAAAMHASCARSNASHQRKSDEPGFAPSNTPEPRGPRPSSRRRQCKPSPWPHRQPLPANHQINNLPLPLGIIGSREGKIAHDRHPFGSECSKSGGREREGMAISRRARAEVAANRRRAYPLRV
jgi:hypothetical protein